MHAATGSAHDPPAAVVQVRPAGAHDAGGGVPAVDTAHAPPNAPGGSARQNAGKATFGMLLPQLVLWPFCGPAPAHWARLDAQRRVYRLRPEPLMELDSWLAPFRRFWSAHVDALERRLDRVEQQSAPKRKTRKARPRGKK